MIQLKLLITKITMKIMLERELDNIIFSKGGGMILRLLDNHKSIQCLSSIVRGHAF